MLGTLPTLDTVNQNKLESIHQSQKYLYQLQDSLIGFFVCLNGEEIILISWGDWKGRQPVVWIYKVFVQSFDSHHNYISNIFIHWARVLQAEQDPKHAEF